MISINDFADYEIRQTLASNGLKTKLELLVKLANKHKLTFVVKHKTDEWEFTNLNEAIDKYNRYI